MSPSSASTSAASIRRSTFRPERAAFNLENDATVATSEDFDPPQHSRASSSRHSVASTVPSLLIVVSSSTKKLVAADHDSVASSLSSTRKVVADANHETVGECWRIYVEGEETSIFKRYANAERQTISPQVPGTESWISRLRRKFSSEKIIRSWSRNGEQTIGNRENKMLLFTRLIKNSNLNDYSNHKRIDGLIRVKERDLEFVCRLGNEKKKLIRENREEDSQETEDLRRIWCEETDQS